ncbi:MAG: phospholipid carrier-dependent glycosyltransferase [Microbacteriaceae bacterium]
MTILTPRAGINGIDHRLVQIIAPLSVTILAMLYRLPGLGTPSTLVFDETYYVKDTHALIEHGWESVWPKDANDSYNQGITDVDENRPAFIVHPQLGKWLMALGQLAFGVDNAFGWRISTAIIGVLMIPLIYFSALLLFRSLTLATIAGFLLAVDGNAIVMSRTALLDGIVAAFALAGFLTMLLDYHWQRRRLQRSLIANANRDTLLIQWWRPWLFVSGIIFGLAASVKWSGFYFLAVFGIYSVVSGLINRRMLGQRIWFRAGSLQAVVNFFTLVPIALAVYIGSWVSWFVNGGYNRDYAGLANNAWTGWLSWVPLDLQSLWQYHVGMYNFHMGLDGTHPYESAAWQWLPMIRPTLFYSVWSNEGERGCEWSRCGEIVQDIGNPLIWWGGTVAVLILLYRLIRKPNWPIATILVGLAAAWLPWLLASGRIAYFFYTITLTPYLILALVAVLGWVMHRGLPRATVAITLGDSEALAQHRGRLFIDTPSWSQFNGIRFVMWFLVAVFVLSLFWLPLYTGMQIPQWFWMLHIWLPSWG